MWGIYWTGKRLLAFHIDKSDYYLRHVCPSVCLQGTTRALVGGFLCNLIFENVFQNLSRKFKFLCRSEKNCCRFVWRRQ
jgi:hypothetical protein